MPEGDTIWRTAVALRSQLEGKRVVAARPGSLDRLAGSTVTAVEPVGKHLIIRFDSGLALHSHMRMRGAWHIYRLGERWRRPEWQLKALIETEDSVAVCFGAPIVELVRNANAKVAHLGPDILGDKWSVSDVVARARAQGSTAVGEILLDQRVIAGIGNVYRCEALWHCRINPWTAISDISDDELRALFETARQAMRGNLRGGWERRFPGYGRGAVHGRGHRPCPRCNTLIKVKAQGEHARTTYWCPNCQPSGPAR